MGESGSGMGMGLGEGEGEGEAEGGKLMSRKIVVIIITSLCG